MSNGHVVTARGDVIDLDGLIQQSSRPLNVKDAKATRETPAFDPTPVKKPKIRGFVPEVGAAAYTPEPKIEEAVPVEKPKGAMQADKKTLADYTAVRVKDTGRKKAQVEAAPVVEDDEDEELGKIIQDM